MFSRIINFIKSKYPGRETIPLHEPKFGIKEKEYLTDAIDSTFVSSIGKYVDLFEEMMCNITGAKFAIATVNGTSALHIALILAGVKPDTEVITQPLSFVATANAISYCSAKPVFLDVSKDTLGMDPNALEIFLSRQCRKEGAKCVNKKSGREITACVPMHTFGHPCRIDLINELCGHYGIALIEDAAESLGSTFKDQHTGTLGKLGIFSFNGNKTVTCGGGGAIVTDDRELYSMAKHLTTTAKVPHQYKYIHDKIGYNYRLPNINAALACAQLERLNDFIDNKRMLAESYSEFFKKEAITFFHEPRHARSNYWLNAVILYNIDARNSFLEATNNVGIMTRPAWKLLNRLAMYQNCETDNLKNAIWLADRIVNIPSSVTQ